MNKNLYEILDEFTNAKTELERRQILVKNASPAFIAFLRLATDKRIKYVLNGEKLEYKPLDMPIGMGYSNYASQLKKMYLFIEDDARRPKDLTIARTKQLAVQLFESMEPQESEVFRNLFAGTLKVPHLTQKLLAKTFPIDFKDYE
jgi:hypothetical protein